MRRIVSLGWIAALCAVAIVGVRRRRRAADRIVPTGDVVPGSAEGRERLVDDASEASFPASDPPSYWGRETGE
ncbi:MAG TPA: hypothetical protein VFT27_03545 [Actinomycetota bacterium]|nr:hypothetical protein [Actinomycetota bacterium]